MQILEEEHGERHVGLLDLKLNMRLSGFQCFFHFLIFRLSISIR